MTDTTTADPGHGTDSHDGPVGGTIEHVDPHNLQVGDNVREYANLNKPFLDRIAEHGVLTPITAIRRPDGVVEVRTIRSIVSAAVSAAVAGSTYTGTELNPSLTSARCSTRRRSPTND